MAPKTDLVIHMPRELSEVAQSGHGFVSTLAAMGAEKHVGLLPQGYSSKPFNPNEFWSGRDCMICPPRTAILGWVPPRP